MFTCNRVFLHCGISTFTKVTDLSTSSTTGRDHVNTNFNPRIQCSWKHSETCLERNAVYRHFSLWAKYIWVCVCGGVISVSAPMPLPVSYRFLSVRTLRFFLPLRLCFLPVEAEFPVPALTAAEDKQQSHVQSQCLHFLCSSSNDTQQLTKSWFNHTPNSI